MGDFDHGDHSKLQIANSISFFGPGRRSLEPSSSCTEVRDAASRPHAFASRMFLSSKLAASVGLTIRSSPKLRLLCIEVLSPRDNVEGHASNARRTTSTWAYPQVWIFDPSDTHSLCLYCGLNDRTYVKAYFDSKAHEIEISIEEAFRPLNAGRLSLSPRSLPAHR